MKVFFLGKNLFCRLETILRFNRQVIKFLVAAAQSSKHDICILPLYSCTDLHVIKIFIVIYEYAELELKQ
jgi:hypothetical protein